ncbi:hypothetical protein DID88_004336 [Monilinia fructigena]|uniref:BTB domain-containing protein n=1 Tax=Monilinia fructigena TaxID=38457 RepID=A0A395IY46_9HELO|nr:hypothetical protein DID88_004336 [Monilinia fructigena]
MAGRSGTSRTNRGETSLDAAMRAPSTTTPDVIVLSFLDEEKKIKEVADPKRDLWVSSLDGRYSSPMIPIRVGAHAQTFYVHRDILTKSEYFRKALDGEFIEAAAQAIDLPEEDPTLFEFVIAFLYESKYSPLRPVAEIIVVEPEKGKGREHNADGNASGSDDGTDSGTASDESARSRRRRESRRRRQERAWEQRQRKEPGRHRPDCNCASCTLESFGPTCWNCGVTRRIPPPRNRWMNGLPPPPQPMQAVGRNGYPQPPGPRDRRRGSRNNTVDEPLAEERMSQEDLRTWSIAYSISVDVYVCAERYLMQDFKSCVAAFIVNNFEIAGSDAALPSVLNSCKALYDGVSSMDPLLKKIFARVGFLQARLWKRYPEETSRFFLENPELSTLILKEMAERREEDVKDDLPAMDRPPLPSSPREKILQTAPAATLKIPFAAPPTGNNRFRAPQPPLPITNGTYNSTQTFPACPQKGTVGSEDCLYLSLYSRPWTTGQPPRPVMVVFFGGGFIQGGGSQALPPSAYPILNVSSQNDILFVYPNYRVNTFGFLPGKEIAEDENSDLNPGLLDQRAVLEWVNKYIEQFGGDRDNVGIWGQSAGAGSVVAQVLANSEEITSPLFNRALASSPFWPKTYNYDAPQAQSIYDTMINLTNCNGAINGTLQCLKSLDWKVLAEAALVVAASHTWNTSSYTWAPVIDGRFLKKTLSEATVNAVGGEKLRPIRSPKRHRYWHTPLQLHHRILQQVALGLPPLILAFATRCNTRCLPESGTAEEFPTYNTSYARAGLIYRDSVLACPALWISKAASEAGWLGEYTISPAKHGSDTIYWNQVNAVQKSQPGIYQGYTGALASFMATGDPNAHKITDATQPGVPALSSETQFVVAGEGLENAAIDGGEQSLEERCKVWAGVAGTVPI